MEFTVDKQNNRVKVVREFAAPLNKVWDAWTKGEILDQWWAPKPWKTRTKKLDFSEGGKWVYAMVGPDGSEQWCAADYTAIRPMESFSMTEYFSDSDGKITDELPVSRWICSFEESSGSTVVTVDIEYDKVEDLEKIIEMGFKEGFTMALGNLVEYLVSIE